jgi:carboxymethylenebutenolidase
VAIYAVYYFDRTGTIRADLETIEDGKHVPLWLDTVSRALDHIASLPQVDAARIALLGISLGAYLALATAATDSERIRAVVDISGGLVEPWASQATASFPPTLIVHGEADSVVSVAEAHRLDQQLSDLGVAHQALILPGEGHWFSPAGNLRIVKAVAGFLTQHLIAVDPASKVHGV